VELLPEGYDPESMIYTNPGGPKIEDLGPEKGKELLRSKLEGILLSGKRTRTSYFCRDRCHADSLCF
jgi:hypothetical protein